MSNNARTHYKNLRADGKACHGGEYQYDLPTQRRDGTWKPGAWTPIRTVATEEKR